MRYGMLHHCTIVSNLVYKLWGCLAILMLAAFTGVGSAQTVTTVYDFTNVTAANPVGPLTQRRDGNLIGTASAPGNGSVYSLSTGGFTSTLFQFNGTNGTGPGWGLTLGGNGASYGTTPFGGASNLGVLFLLDSTGVYSVIHEFSGGSDGGLPAGPPIEASDGNLYGATYGVAAGLSTIYKYALSSGVFTTIYQFDQAHGEGIYAPLVQAADGTLYGTASLGGANNCGTIFQLTKVGKLQWYYSFPCGAGGSTPLSPLIQAADGNLYGTTDVGGSFDGSGTIFKVDRNRKVSILYTFAGNKMDGRNPAGGLVQATDGNLYGTTVGGGRAGVGTLFQISTVGAYKQLAAFSKTTPQTPQASLLQHTNGKLYGTATYGGRFGFGAVYSLDLGLGPFVTFVAPTGKVGGTAQILGQGLTGTTSVSFNGVNATTFKVVSDTYLTATVPTGATSGLVVVTTPTGGLTSNVKFRISGHLAAQRKPSAKLAAGSH